MTNATIFGTVLSDPSVPSRIGGDQTSKCYGFKQNALPPRCKYSSGLPLGEAENFADKALSTHSRSHPKPNNITSGGKQTMLSCHVFRILHNIKDP